MDRCPAALQLEVARHIAFLIESRRGSSLQSFDDLVADSFGALALQVQPPPGLEVCVSSATPISGAGDRLDFRSSDAGTLSLGTCTSTLPSCGAALAVSVDTAVNAEQPTPCEGFDESHQAPVENVYRQKNRRHLTSVTPIVDAELSKLKQMLSNALERSSSPVAPETQKMWSESCNRSKEARETSRCSLTTMVSGDLSGSTFVPPTCSGHCDSIEEKGISWSFMQPVAAPSSPPVRGRAKAKSVQKTMGHKSVPKGRLEEMYKNSSKEEPPTTMMIRNIPYQYSHQRLMEDLNGLGFTGTYDFLYIPMDMATSNCVGNAFVNFISPIWAKKCRHIFQNYRFDPEPGELRKPFTAKVSVAHLQGLKKNLEHYEHSAVNTRLPAIWRPVVMAYISSSCP